MNLEKILTRLDAEAYQEILGDEVLGTLLQMGTEYSYSDGLRKILTNTFSNEELLKEYREEDQPISYGQPKE